MFTKRNGDPFPALWFLIAIIAVVLVIVTVFAVLGSIWLLSWQLLATAVVTCILAGIACTVTFLWADDMS